MTGVPNGGPRAVLPTPIALLFPGQGVQRPGMGRNLYERYPAARRVLVRAEDVLGLPVRRLCFEGPLEELNRTEVIQPCLMAVCWAAYEVYRDAYGLGGVQVMAGHSLGEFTALAAAGAISWETALHLVVERGRIMANAAVDRPGAMIAIVGLDEGRVEEIRQDASAFGRLYMANRNAENQFVLSGEMRAIEESERLALAAGARRALILTTIMLPAHSPLMEAAGNAFKSVLDRLPIEMPEFPILANATGQAVASINDLRQELTNHLLRPVDWARTMVSLRRMQVRTVVELGPGRVLASLAAKHLPGVETWNAEELFIDFVDAAPA
ncbi:MAG TPA: ACP S-malonyltransferase [Candidatus Dormibacteraeota bacterium]|nr:ACP S-malonyltransferase [Candidatus Dormibacteraeota bacterium]